MAVDCTLLIETIKKTLTSWCIKLAWWSFKKFRGFYYKLKWWGVSFDYSGYFLGMGHDGDKDDIIRILSFQTKGFNHSFKPIVHLNGAIVSSLTNKNYPLFLSVNGNITKVEATYGIPARAHFSIVIPFADNFEGDSFPVGFGITSNRFLREMGKFTFSFHYDSKNYSKCFSYRRTKALIEKFRSSLHKPVKPTVTLKP